VRWARRLKVDDLAAAVSARRPSDSAVLTISPNTSFVRFAGTPSVSSTLRAIRQSVGSVDVLYFWRNSRITRGLRKASRIAAMSSPSTVGETTRRPRSVKPMASAWAAASVNS
jgi:hypothetical protein